mmetsp:Transcript_8915/g.25697  ORF Transcript_8915/g.25697 Transcript_8915/m.25697 type:complete len:304 (+) Transcript_8915:1831-2742(+)
MAPFKAPISRFEIDVTKRLSSVKSSGLAPRLAFPTSRSNIPFLRFFSVTATYSAAKASRRASRPLAAAMRRPSSLEASRRPDGSAAAAASSSSAVDARRAVKSATSASSREARASSIADRSAAWEDNSNIRRFSSRSRAFSANRHPEAVVCVEVFRSPVEVFRGGDRTRFAPRAPSSLGAGVGAGAGDGVGAGATSTASRDRGCFRLGNLSGGTARFRTDGSGGGALASNVDERRGAPTLRRVDCRLDCGCGGGGAARAGQPLRGGSTPYLTGSSTMRARSASRSSACRAAQPLRSGLDLSIM